MASGYCRSLDLEALGIPRKEKVSITCLPVSIPPGLWSAPHFLTDTCLHQSLSMEWAYLQGLGYFLFWGKSPELWMLALLPCSCSWGNIMISILCPSVRLFHYTGNLVWALLKVAVVVFAAKYRQSKGYVLPWEVSHLPRHVMRLGTWKCFQSAPPNFFQNIPYCLLPP